MPMAAAPLPSPPAPTPSATDATLASTIESLLASSVTAPIALTVLSVIAALALLKMLLIEAAPPPLIARALLDAAAIDTLAATVSAWMSASSDAVSSTAPRFAVTLESSISASTSLLMELNAIEMPTAIAPAFPLPDTPTAIAPAIASAWISDVSVDVSETLFAMIVLLFLMLA